MCQVIVKSSDDQMFSLPVHQRRPHRQTDCRWSGWPSKTHLSWTQVRYCQGLGCATVHVASNKYQVHNSPKTKVFIVNIFIGHICLYRFSFLAILALVCWNRHLSSKMSLVKGQRSKVFLSTIVSLRHLQDRQQFTALTYRKQTPCRPCIPSPGRRQEEQQANRGRRYTVPKGLWNLLSHAAATSRSPRVECSGTDNSAFFLIVERSCFLVFLLLKKKKKKTHFFHFSRIFVLFCLSQKYRRTTFYKYI